MAHFAELDENNVVLRVIVVNNEDTSDSNGIEDESIGIGFCKRLLGANTRWKQTSYNDNFRVRYAGIGYVFDEERDAFLRPQPFPSWSLNEQTLEWESPAGPTPELTEEQKQSHCNYRWDEETQQWILETPGE